MRWLLLALTLLTLPALAEVRDAQTHFFQAKLGDFKDELATAKQEGKSGVLIMFEMDDCPFCHRMKATVLNQSALQDWYRKHFLLYNMDVKGDVPMTDFKGKATREKDFALEVRARATPTFIFFDLEGNPVARFTGPTQTAEEFLLLGRWVLEGHYKTVAFNIFKRQPPK
ncbi:MAG: thioredoxin fold domain-containing protein [Betaproteobacteria bacterium]|nr:thioredoxin fold domain-containing protein [Betaproteobacteria bacterium]